MAMTKTVSTRTTAPRSAVEQRIQWGNIIKGALIVGAVAVVAVVGFNLAAGVVGPFVAGNSTLVGIFSGIGHAATSLFALAGAGLNWIGGALFGLATPVLNATGITGVATAATANPAATAGVVAQIAGWAVAAGAVFLSFPLVKKLFSTMPLVAPEHVTIAGKVEHHISQAKTPETAVVTEKSVENHGSSSQVSSSKAWADSVPQAERRDIAPRDASHTAQVTQEAALAAAAKKAL